MLCSSCLPECPESGAVPGVKKCIRGLWKFYINQWNIFDGSCGTAAVSLAV
jgi:hypothetical protein